MNESNVISKFLIFSSVLEIRLDGSWLQVPDRLEIGKFLLTKKTTTMPTNNFVDLSPRDLVGRAGTPTSWGTLSVMLTDPSKQQLTLVGSDISFGRATVRRILLQVQVLLERPWVWMENDDVL